jgi:hypothetical protein
MSVEADKKNGSVDLEGQHFCITASTSTRTFVCKWRDILPVLGPFNTADLF